MNNFYLNKKHFTVFCFLITSLLSLNTRSQCTAVSTLNEDFNAYNNGDPFPISCWAWVADPSLTSAIPLAYINEDTSVIPSEKAVALYSFTYTTRDFYLISPALSTINGNYQLTFDAKLFSSLGTGSTLQIGTLDSQTSVTNFTLVGTTLSPTTTNQTFTSIAIPATTGHQYVAIKFTPGGNHSTVLIDNIVWGSTIPVAVQSVDVTTQNNVPPTITTSNGTLQLQASVLPSTVSQNITWSVQSGTTFASVDNTGLVTAIANGTATIRVTSVADPTKYDEINIVINTLGTCTAVSSFFEDFDDPTLTCCSMGMVPDCWNSISTATGANQIISTTSPASGTNNIYQIGYGTGKVSIVVMPEVNNINAATHQFRFKVRANSGPGDLDFGYITDITDASTFVTIQTMSVSNSSYNDPAAERTFTVPTTVPVNARLAIRNPGTSWAGFYWDDASWEPIPQTTCTDPGPNAGDTGCVTFTYDGASTTLTTVRGADGNIWLQQNLGSSQVATSMTDTLSYGDVYQWGRWNDGHEKRTSTTASVTNPNDPTGLTTPNNSFIIGSSTDWWDGGSLTDTWSAISPSNISSTDGCDPCKAIAAGWEMPTQNDWTNIQSTESINNPTSAYASNLKLPASGYRSSSTGNYTFVDQRGYFWSSTTSSTGAKYFYIGSSMANPAAGAMRGQGHAVRCIYKGTQNNTSVVINTLNNVPATITTSNGTLQLEASVLPSTVSQNVTWSVQSGTTFASVNNTGLVTAIANGTAIIRATSVADTSVYGEITITVNALATPSCPAVTTIDEDFETFTTFPENCWSSNKTAPQIDLATDQNNGNHYINLYSHNNATDEIYLISPELSTIDGNHLLEFDIINVEANATTTTIEIGTMTDNTDSSTFTPVGSPFTSTVGTHSSALIPANAGHKYVAIKYTPNGVHQAIFVDNIKWTTTASAPKFDTSKVVVYPNPTMGVFNIETELDVKQIEVYNSLGQKVLTTSNRQINLQTAANGLYFVTVITNNGAQASYKLIKK